MDGFRIEKETEGEIGGSLVLRNEEKVITFMVPHGNQDRYGFVYPIIRALAGWQESNVGNRRVVSDHFYAIMFEAQGIRVINNGLPCRKPSGYSDRRNQVVDMGIVCDIIL